MRCALRWPKRDKLICVYTCTYDLLPCVRMRCINLGSMFEKTAHNCSCLQGSDIFDATRCLAACAYAAEAFFNRMQACASTYSGSYSLLSYESPTTVHFCMSLPRSYAQYVHVQWRSRPPRRDRQGLRRLPSYQRLGSQGYRCLRYLR